jgi:two-component system, repressor protein LuxO
MPATVQPEVLLIEDSPSLAMTYQEYMRKEPWNISHVTTGQDSLPIINQTPPTVILLDLKLPDMNGMDILKEIHAKQIPCSVIIITGHASTDIAIEAVRYGAFDFLEKPFNGNRLLVTVRNALKQFDLTRTVETYQENYERSQFHRFLGASLAMQGIYRMIENAAPSKASVFITGESGTGKELCAEAIHKVSPRQEKPFITLNCATIPKDLMESEIFGHVRGAFTGAVSEHTGAATRADGGTLFLDEIGEMPLNLQSKLLRFTQSGEFQKVGGTKTLRTDIRFVCATNRDPWQSVQEGLFREDLFFRLSVIPIHLPPLREREQDILLIAYKFLEQFTKEEGKKFERFSPDVEATLLNNGWPGNVRQLQNVIRNIVVMNNGIQVEKGMLPSLHGSKANLEVSTFATSQTHNNSNQNIRAVQPTDYSTEIIPLWQVEKDAIERAINLCGDNIPQAAAKLEVNPSTIYRKRQNWNK